MKPHIKKVNGLWWCGNPKDSNMFLWDSHRTPELAYQKWVIFGGLEIAKGWCKETKTPHQGGVISCNFGKQVTIRRPISG